jgi:hypothetical protein
VAGTFSVPEISLKALLVVKIKVSYLNNYEMTASSTEITF